MRRILILLTLICFFLPVSKVYGDEQILFSDNFNDGNLNGWIVEVGNWFVNNGNLSGSKSGRAFAGRVNSGPYEWDNYRLELDLNNQSGIDCGVGFRYTQGGDSYELNLRTGTGSFDTPEAILRKNQDGVVSVLADTHSTALVNNKWYHLKIEVVGERIKIWIDNVEIFDILDTGTKVKKGTVTLSYWTGDVGVIFTRFDNVVVTSLGLPPPVKTPLILIPGIGGSELKVMDDTLWLDKDDGHGGVLSLIYPKDEKVWVNEGEAAKIGDDDYFDVLRMKKDGVESEANIGLTGNLYAGGYQEAINFFVDNGYTLNQNLFVFPYDWRRDLSETKPLLDEKIQQIKQQTGSDKVDIVAHSMGGLVARNYISDPIKAQNVRKLFTLGTPHLGSVDALKNLRYGGCLRFEVGPFCLSFAPTEVKDVLQNIIGGFELVPTQAYFNFYSNENNSIPFPYKTELGSMNYNQIKNLLTILGHNTSLFTPSENFHSLDSILTNTNGVEVIIIAGSEQPTIGQIIEVKTKDFLGIERIHKDILNINGDGIVPLFSASLNDSDRNLTLLGDARVFYTKQKHGNLVSNGASLNMVKNILSGNEDLPEGVSSSPYKLKGSLFSVHSPVNIHVYDSAGNHTGPTPDGFEANIPGSSYDSLGDGKFVYVPEDGIYTIKFEATDKGSFDFKIREYQEDNISEQILYKDIPLENTTKGELKFDTLATSTEAPKIDLDKDGNGTADSTYNPTSILSGDQAGDSIPPQTTINVNASKGLNGWYKSDVIVTLNPQDEEGGSGVLRTEYSLDNGVTINTYNDPFVVSKEDINKLKVRSIDKAGNTEDPKEIEIKIDKTSPEVKVYVDQNILDLVISGVDSNPTTVISQPNTETKKKDDAVYKITDTAGNVTKLDVREREKDKKDRFRIYSIQYNSQTPIILDNNYFNVTYIGKKDKMNLSEQNFEIKKEVKIRIKYDAKKNESTIITKEPKEEKVKENRAGLILLQLLTNKGSLETSY